MPLSKQQFIDEKAQRVFVPALPETWIYRKREPDYRIDYQIEIFENSESTGLEFAVQLKGVEKPRFVKKSVRFSVESDHLAYWVEKTRHPVFLVVIDVETKKGWWVFIQKAFREGKIKNRRPNQKSVTVELSVSNSIHDIPSWRQAVADAVPYMSNLWPGAIGPTILAEKARLEQLDPRLNVQINAIDDKLNYAISSKGEPVILRYTFHGKDEEDFRTNVTIPLDRGEPILITPSRVTVSGSKLFAQGLERAVSIQIQRLSDADVKIRVADGEYLIDSIKAKLVAGIKNLQVLCGLGNGLLEIEFESVPPEEIEGQASMSFNLRLERYYGKEILTLPYFDQLHRFISAVAQEKKIVIEFWREGNLFLSIPVWMPDITIFRDLYSFVEPVHQARVIARWLSLSPKLPSNVRSFFTKDIELLHSLMADGEARRVGDKFQVSVLATNRDELEEGMEIGEIQFPIAHKQFSVYDVVVDFYLDIQLTEATIHKIEQHSELRHWTFICEGVPGSEIVFRRAADNLLLEHSLFKSM